jgi:hypothetical protein
MASLTHKMATATFVAPLCKRECRQATHNLYRCRAAICWKTLRHGRGFLASSRKQPRFAGKRSRQRPTLEVGDPARACFRLPRGASHLSSRLDLLGIFAELVAPKRAQRRQ